MARKASPHHGHHGPACGLGLRGAWSSLGLRSEPSGTPMRLLPPTHFPMQPSGGSELGRGCLGVSSESLQDEAAAGTALAAPGRGGGAALGHSRVGAPSGDAGWGSIPLSPGDVPAAATQPLALAQPSMDCTEFAHFRQTQKLENMTGAKAGQGRGGRSFLPHGSPAAVGGQSPPHPPGHPGANA